MNILLPANLTFKAWFLDLNRTISNAIVPTPFDDKDWQKWAMLLISTNNFKSTVLPLKKNFPSQDDWKKWAYFFISDMYSQ